MGRKDITKLEYIEKGLKCNSEHIKQANSPKLNIWAGIHKYELGNSTHTLNNLTPLEFDWLANELSNWLGIPIDYE